MEQNAVSLILNLLDYKIHSDGQTKWLSIQIPHWSSAFIQTLGN